MRGCPWDPLGGGVLVNCEKNLKMRPHTRVCAQSL